MRCDDVFEILTSAPFPSGLSVDESVEQHLTSCHECRSFAEALRPVSLASLHSMLPAYSGRMDSPLDSADSAGLVDQILQLVEREHASQGRLKNSSKSLLRSALNVIGACAAACVFGAAVTFGGQLWLERQHVEPPRLVEKSSLLHSNATRCESQLLVSIKSSEVVPVHVKKSPDSCCLNCHGGQSKERAKRKDSIGLVVMSCQKCHEGKSEWVRL